MRKTQKTSKKAKKVKKSNNLTIGKLYYMILNALIGALLFALPYNYYIRQRANTFFNITMLNIGAHIIAGLLTFILVRISFTGSYLDYNNPDSKTKRWVQQLLSVLVYSLIIYLGIYQYIIDLGQDTWEQVLIMLLISLIISIFTNLLVWNIQREGKK